MANWDSNSVSILMGNGDGTSGAKTDYAVGTSPSSVAVGDVNGDGWMDVAVTNAWADSLTVFLGAEPPIAVALAFFTAQRRGDDVVLSWEVAEASADHAGFEVYRKVQGEPRARISTSLLTGQARYGFVDAQAPTLPAEYWLAELTRAGERTWHGPVHVPPSTFPGLELVLSPNTPNPFDGVTRLRFVLPSGGDTRLDIFDVTGRNVARLLDGVLLPGEHDVAWDGTDEGKAALPSGVYFCRLLTSGGSRTLRLLLRR